MADGIERLRTALRKCPPDHSLRPSYLNLLARSLRIRFKQQGVPSDLDEVIDLQRAALALCPPGHSYCFSSLNNLANNLRTRFEQQGVMSDLDEVIDLHRTALALHSPSHSDQSSSRNNLAISLQDRFEQQGVLHDLDEAIDLHRAKLALYPLHHPNRSISLRNLAISLRDRFKWQGLSPDLDEAFGLYTQLLQVSHTVSHHDLEAAKSWVISAEQLKHSSALAAYQTALRFLDDWQHIDGVSSSSRYFDMVREATSSLAMDAFACSIHHGALTTAVELLEQGRAVFWTQLARFNAPLDDICGSGDIGKGLAAEFKEISFRLRNMLEDPTINRMTEIHQLTKERDNVISRIRVLPDFSRFLLPPLFSDLQKSAKNGPVIIVNASTYGCDALIIQSSQDPVHVPLDITKAKVSELSTEFRFITEDAGSSDDRLSVHRIVGILRQLWEHIVGPIVKALRELIIPGSRIWWCPTAEFTLLPLHVAGPYEKKSRNLPHLYISSYIPTLAALIRARQQVARDTSTSRFVAIGQGTPDKGKVLPRVAAELGDIAQCVAPLLPFTSLAASNATVRQALEALSRHQWVHLACHGMPNRKKPFESSFAMYDGPLTVTDIIRTYPQNHEFAFLSACHTTVGHASSPDEAIHLAAAMQFSGFRSVIGSMWSVDDEFVGQLVSTFYDYMFDGSGGLDCTRAAVALHETVKKLRKKIPFEQQIVLIHIGV